MTSTSEVMLCSPQKSSISCVSAIPPIGEPERLSAEDQAEGRNRERLFRCADQRDVAVATEQTDIGVDVVIGSNCVENEVKAIGVLLHFVGIAGDNDFIRTQAKRIILLVRRSGEDDDVRSERMSKFYRHMAETTQTDHSYFLTFRDIPMAHGRVSGYACAQERRRCREFEVGRNSEYKNCSSTTMLLE